LLPKLWVSLLARVSRHKAAGSLYWYSDLVIIVLHTKVLKNFAEISSLRKT
jgi:hypothetical protein